MAKELSDAEFKAKVLDSVQEMVELLKRLVSLAEDADEARRTGQ